MSIITIASLGDDALQNQWQVVIPAFPGILDPVQTNFRVTNFTVPDRVVNTYDVHYKTQKFTKPAGKDGSENNFSFSFRVDKFWTVYNGFLKWHKLIIDPITGAQAPDFVSGVSSIRIPITVLTLDSNNTPTSTGWTFNGCYPSTVPGTELSYENGEPITIAITMQYLTVDPLPV